MSPDIIAQVRKHAAEQYPNEACGYVIAGRKRAEVVLCTNVHENPKDFFRIAREETTRIADQGEILAVWHTHPNRDSRPSAADLVGVEVMGVPWLIQGFREVEGGDFDFAPYTVTEPTGFQMPYTERPYVPGVFDCWSLVVDYYARELGIRLNRYPYTQEDGTPGFHLFSTQYEAEGFARLLGRQEYRKGDVFFMQVLGDRPNHCAVYIGDDQVLQHNHGRLSSRDVFGTRSKYVTHHLRHKTLCS